MPRVFLKIAFILSALPAFAQLDSNTVTVVASRSVKILPDQASINVVVAAPPTATLEEVLAVLAGSGIMAADLSYLMQYDARQMTPIYWYFRLTVPLTKVKEATVALSKLQGNSTAFLISFAVLSVETSDVAVRAQSCKAADLLADARVQAQEIAAATGRVLERLVAMSGSTADECSITVKFLVTGF